jgi:hypothetical protein
MPTNICSVDLYNMIASFCFTFHDKNTYSFGKQIKTHNEEDWVSVYYANMCQNAILSEVSLERLAIDLVLKTLLYIVSTSISKINYKQKMA